MRLQNITIILLFFTFQTIAQDLVEVKSMIAVGKEDQAIETLNGFENKNDITYLNLLGEAQLRKGLYEAALENFKKSEYLQEQDPQHKKEILAETYSFIALVHWTTGNDQLSLQYHFKALEIRRATGNRAGVAASTNDIGLVYSRKNPEKALEYYLSALNEYQQLYGENDERTATAFVNMGIAYSNLGVAQNNDIHYRQALNNLNNALTIRQQKGRGSTQEAFIHSSVGVVYTRMNQPEKALQEYEIALSIYKKAYGNKHPEIAGIHNLIGNTLYAQGNFKDALNSYQQAFIANLSDFNDESIYQNPQPENYYNADILLQSLFAKAKAFEDYHNSFSLRIKDLEMAYSTIDLCDNLIDKIRQFRSSESDKVALGSLAAEIYESAIRISLNIARVKWKKQPYREKAFYYADKSKSAVLLEAIADANAKSFAGIPDDLLEQERFFKAQVTYFEQKLAGKPTPTEEEMYRKELFEWTKNYNELIASLEELYPTYFDLKHNVQVPSVSDVQAKLREDKALISYFVASEDNLIYAFVVTMNKIKVYEIPLMEEYEMYISGYRNAMYYDAPNTYKKTARSLYEQLLPFKLPASIKNLVIIPAGRMATIPFESLISEDIDLNSRTFSDIPYLINDYFISYQYSSSLYLNPHIEMPPSTAIALFAPVEFPNQRLSSLPGTKTEVEDIGNLFASSSADVSLYLENQATVGHVKTIEVTKSKFLHFATHGIVDEMKPEQSQICLASTDGIKGSLYSGDIYGLNLSSDLVVLSACETGLGKISKGEGIIGLTRALIYAGSNNLVVSLWRVGDASTSSLMTDFYKYMLEGNSYAKALSKAKLKMIGSEEYSSPYFWAPFVLIGE
ncbi:MAG: CHAT domain-containing tetratricopeptide repeat protein [Bacteroidota bacterium]